MARGDGRGVVEVPNPAVHAGAGGQSAERTQPVKRDELLLEIGFGDVGLIVPGKFANELAACVEDFEDDGSSEIVARRLTGSTVVKALNHIGYHELEDQARPAGAPDRRAAAVAGDDPAATAAIAGLADRIGYDPVRLESLRAGRVLQPGGPVFGAVLTRPEFEQAVREDARSFT